MKGLCFPNAFSANATFLALLLLVTSSPFIFQHCLAKRELHHRPAPSGRHHQPPPVPVMPMPPPPTSTFSVLDYGAVGMAPQTTLRQSLDKLQPIDEPLIAFTDAWSAACDVQASKVLVPASYVFLVGPITFTGDSCEPNMVFQVDGTILAHAADTAAWSSGVVTQWLEFKNVRGLTIQGCGAVDGQGSQWWRGGSVAGDAKMATEGNLAMDSDRVGTSNRPTAVRVFQGANVTVMGITIRNSPRFHLTFDTCRAVEVHDVAVSSPGDSPNTDGIHLAASVGVSIHHSIIACGDDCISIQDGCSDVLVRSVHCGPGHGISIGGLGKSGASAAVSDVTVQDITLNQTMTGVRIKTWQGGPGSVKNVRFSDVRVSAVKTPIVIDQYYCDHAACSNQTSAVAVAGVSYQGVAGTYTERPVYLACSDDAPCSGIHLADIQLAPVKDGGHHVQGPFCWKAYGDAVRPVEPPVDCLL